MNEIDKRKLNLLVHLAKVDGRYERSEHKLLKQFVREKKLKQTMLSEQDNLLPLDTHLWGTECKIELLYWAIKLIKADEIIHEKEIAFGESVASKLHFKQGVVTHYVNKPLMDYETFKSDVSAAWVAG